MCLPRLITAHSVITYGGSRFFQSRWWILPCCPTNNNVGSSALISLEEALKFLERVSVHTALCGYRATRECFGVLSVHNGLWFSLYFTYGLETVNGYIKPKGYKTVSHPFLNIIDKVGNIFFAFFTIFELRIKQFFDEVQRTLPTFAETRF